MLRNLWQQTRAAYIENPLPALFKEQLAALLARHCAARYCLLCHTCSLKLRSPSAIGTVQDRLPRTVRAGLFEPFKGTASLSEAASRSAGLGLYIVQQIVQAHDGEIRVHSDAPMTQFTIVLKCEGGEPQTT
ncbi:MAG TPA: ATP-binding protein [Casimicrobiaceae bacterium]|nr:ATP-binding protein [Casimicrobiaceae bacterium]